MAPTNGGSIQVSLKENNSNAELIIKDDGKESNQNFFQIFLIGFFMTQRQTAMGAVLVCQSLKRLLNFMKVN